MGICNVPELTVSLTLSEFRPIRQGLEAALLLGSDVPIHGSHLKAYLGPDASLAVWIGEARTGNRTANPYILSGCPIACAMATSRNLQPGMFLHAADDDGSVFAVQVMDVSVKVRVLDCPSGDWWLPAERLSLRPPSCFERFMKCLRVELWEDALAEFIPAFANVRLSDGFGPQCPLHFLLRRGQRGGFSSFARSWRRTRKRCKSTADMRVILA